MEKEITIPEGLEATIEGSKIIFKKIESKDERIRKELIEHVKDQQSSFISAPDCRDKYEEEENNKYNSWLSWLEKQGEHKKFRDSIQVGDEVTRNSDGVIVNLSQLKRVAKPAQQKLPIEKLPEEMKTIGESLGFTTQEECDEYNQMVSDLIMSDNKVKPKFHEGEWVVFNDKHESVYQIEKIENFQYILRHILGGSMPLSFSGEDMIRPWAIQDAKNGDVLCCGNEISLYKHDIKNCTKQETTFGGFVYHCCYDGKRFITDSLYSLTEQDKMDIHPATKEQRDILFAKIKEAGYEWDENNKILKEIVEDEEEPQNYKNQVMSEITDLVKHYIKQKPACSEASEDMKEALQTEYEKGRADAIAEIRKKWDDSKKKRQEVISFLESLRLKED